MKTITQYNYGLFDNVSSQWLEKPYGGQWMWSSIGGEATSNIHLFNSISEATRAADGFTKLFRKHQPKARIDWSICKISVKFVKIISKSKTIKRIKL